MSKFRYVIFEVSPDTDEEVCLSLAWSGSPTWETLSTQHWAGDHPLPQPGDRCIKEFKTEISQDRSTRTRFSRLAPWVVESVETYVPDLPVGQRFDEIVICTCAHSPLPESENPWVPVNRLAPNVESFGGDATAFEAWRSGQGSEQAVGVTP